MLGSANSSIQHMLSLRSDVEIIDDPSTVQLIVTDVTLDQNFNIALAVLLLYDILINMDKEVKYFLQSPRKFVSLVFFVNCINGLLGAFTTVVWGTFNVNITEFASWTIGLSNFATLLLIDYILILRVLALFSKNNRLAWLLRAVLFLISGSTLGIVIYDTWLEHTAVGGFTNGVTFCGFDNVPPRPLPLAAWSMDLILGFLLACLAVYKAHEFWKLSVGFKGFQLISVIVRDQVIYFLFAIFCGVLQIICMQLANTNPFVADLLNAAGSPTLLCILGNRLLVHLKEAGEKGENGGTSLRLSSMREIKFL